MTLNAHYFEILRRCAALKNEAAECKQLHRRERLLLRALEAELDATLLAHAIACAAQDVTAGDFLRREWAASQAQVFHLRDAGFEWKMEELVKSIATSPAKTS